MCRIDAEAGRRKELVLDAYVARLADAGFGELDKFGESSWENLEISVTMFELHIWNCMLKLSIKCAGALKF